MPLAIRFDPLGTLWSRGGQFHLREPDLVPFAAKQRAVRAVLNNSFGFGGTNASLVMKQVA